MKRSKDNTRIHQKFKEYFDMPKKYEYDWTVGKSRGIVKHSVTHGWREHYKPTAFFLKKEKGNVYKVDKRVEKSVEQNLHIPFLRQVDDPITKWIVVNSVERQSKGSRPHKKLLEKVFKWVKEREKKWAEVGKPISAYNEAIHKSMKLGFEDI